MTVIAQNFGRPVVSTGYRQTNPVYWEEQDGFYVEDFGEINTVAEDDDWVEYDMGWYFDGLRFGVNLVVMVLTSDNRVTEIKATYNGYVVFAEIEGRIKAYAPFDSWENPMEDIFVGATAADDRRKDREKKQKAKENKTKLDKVWKMVKMLWGG